MYDRTRDEVAWVRLQDHQREVENRRLWMSRPSSGRTVKEWAWILLRGVRPRWWAVG